MAAVQEREGMTVSGIIGLAKTLDLRKRCNDKYYHNAGRLLKLYKGVAWRLSHSLNEMDEECRCIGNVTLKKAMQELIDMDSDLSRLKLDERMESITVSYQMIQIVDRALAMLKDYPYRGEQYFEIINRVHILDYPYTEQEMLDRLRIGKTTYYKYKKEAVAMLGVVLWGFVIPELRAAVECGQSHELYAGVVNL